MADNKYRKHYEDAKERYKFLRAHPERNVEHDFKSRAFNNMMFWYARYRKVGIDFSPPFRTASYRFIVRNYPDMIKYLKLKK